MIPLLRHLGHEGKRHTGCYGFGGRGLRRPGDHLQYHGTEGGPHFLTTAAGWEQLQRMLRPAVVAPAWEPGAVARLLGGYDSLPVFVDSCPCLTRVLTDGRLAAAAERAFRYQPMAREVDPPNPFLPFIGGST